MAKRAPTGESFPEMEAILSRPVKLDYPAGLPVIRTGFLLSPATKRRLARVAKDRGTSMSAEAERALAGYCAALLPEDQAAAS